METVVRSQDRQPTSAARNIDIDGEGWLDKCSQSDAGGRFCGASPRFGGVAIIDGGFGASSYAVIKPTRVHNV
jgi:hypothetical protein